MSISRQFRRAICRKTGKEWLGKPTPFRVHKNGGYDALHPTKGWRRISARRLRAQTRLRNMIERVEARKPA